MLYENYQKKIEQRKKFKDFLKRFRIYLITVGVTLLAVFFTLFSVKGIITDQLLLASSYSYGNSYGDDYSSSAFMGSAKYEFALKDSDSWSENAPYLAGDYKMRAYAYNNYGKKYYGNIQYFSISKQPVTLSIIDYPNGIDYGNKPAIVPEGLVSGDKIESYEVSYTDISKDVDTLECQVDVSSVVIKNSADEDVTSCYDFTSEKKNIKVIDRLLDITYESATKEYDGKPLIASGYEITRGSLLSGDRFASLPHADSSYTDVGEYKNSCSSLKILNSADEDVTNRYSIGTGGTLSITPRQVSVQTRSQSFEYDGKGHYLNEMDILSGSLISGDSLILTYNINKDNPVTEVGIYDNDFAVYAADSEGDPNMSNYCITMNSGTISITKRPLHIQTTRDYFYDENGLVLEASDYQFKDNTSLAEGNRLSLSYKKEGEESAFIYHIYDKDNNDVTSQYEVMINDDAVPGRKRNLNFVFDSKSKVYDGTPLESKFVFDSSEVADRDQINTVSETIGPEVTVKSDFLVCDYQILDKEDNSDHSEYYNITTTPGSLEIIKKPLAISINSFSKVYDEIIYTEIPLEESDYILDSNDKDFLDSLNHTLTVSLKSEYYLLNPGEITDPNAYTARISDAENNDVTSNYSISFRLNGVFITKRKVNITSSQETYDFYYDTQEIDVASALNYETSCDPEIEASGLISGHTLFFAVNEPITEPGTYDLSQYVSFKITSGNIDVTSSYDINVLDYGKVKVNKYRIIVQAPSYIYDGTDKISSSEKDYTYQNIPQGYSPSVTFDSNLSPVESEDKEYQVYDKKVKTMVLTPSDTSKPTLYYDRSQSLDSDFEVDDALSSLLIKKREVTVNFSGSYFYSGVSYEPDEIEFESLVDPNNPDTGL
ncbi:MAG: hypothetical protein WCR67_06310, partial [Bacilli bacterium]